MARLPIPGSDNDIWGNILNEYLSIEHNPDGTLNPNGTIASKANDTDVVHNTGDESIDGTKTFTSPVIVATPITGTHAATKTYVDGVVSAGAADATTTTKGILQLTGDLSGTATAPTVPALAGKEATITAGTTLQYWRGDKTFQTLDKSAVGLSNVDNTSDINKPVSTAQQTAIDAKVADAINDGVTTVAPSENAVFDALATKQPLDSDLTAIAGLSPADDDIIQRKSGAWINRTPAQFKTDLSLTKADVGLSNVDNTSDANKPVSTAQQAAIDAKVADAINDGVTTIAPSQNAVFDALALKQNSLGFTPEDVANKSTNTSLGTSNILYPTQNAVKSYVDTVSALDLKIASNLSDLANVATARTNLGLVAGGAGDIWVEKAGDTMTGALNIAVATGTPLVVNTNTLVADAANNRVGVGTATPGTKLTVDGVISAKAGTSTGQIVKVGGTIFSYTTDAGNTTTTETDLYTDSIPASTLTTDKDKLAARYGGEMVGSATATRRLRVYFGGTAIFDTGAFAVSAANDWDLDVLIIRVSATVVRFSCRLNITNTTPTALCNVGELTGLTLSNANILKITGQAAGVGAATNDIVARLGTVEWKPAP